MVRKKVSVVIPVFNVEQYIEVCIQSLLNQTYNNLEIILVNDGSTDSSGLLCDKFAQQDDRVLVVHKANGGVSSARNIGIDNSSGEYIMFVDPDDWVDTDMVECIVKDFENNDADAVFCGYWENYEESTGLTPVIHSPVKTGEVDGKAAIYQCLIDFGHGYFTAVWNKCFKADFVKQSGVYFEKYTIAEDELWLIKLLLQSKAVYLDNRPFYHWRQSSGSAIRGKGRYNKWYSALEAKKQIIDLLRADHQLKELAKAKLYNNLFNVVYKSYLDGEKTITKDFMHKLKPYESCFYKCENYSKMKKLKFRVLKILVNMKMPKLLVEKLANLNSYRIKESVKNGI
ncbi:MAG: glycosyltransferase [Oscillospiraceae bacterium]|nr:glycosyltransferase [Oscillospiraceae bacterium]